MARAAPFFVEQPVTCNVTRNVFKEPSNEKNISAKITNIDAYREWGLQGKPFWENYQKQLASEIEIYVNNTSRVCSPLTFIETPWTLPQKI
jgi:hypothetical protein